MKTNSHLGIFLISLPIRFIETLSHPKPLHLLLRRDFRTRGSTFFRSFERSHLANVHSIVFPTGGPGSRGPFPGSGFLKSVLGKAQRGGSPAAGDSLRSTCPGPGCFPDPGCPLHGGHEGHGGTRGFEKFNRRIKEISTRVEPATECFFCFFFC